MVLWDPVTGGAGFIDELTARHGDMLRRTHIAEPDPPRRGARDERLGMALSAIDEIRALDALTLSQKPAPKVLVIGSEGAARTTALRERLASLGACVRYEDLPVDNAWTWIEDVNRVLVPQHIVTRIVAWFSETHA